MTRVQTVAAGPAPLSPDRGSPNGGGHMSGLGQPETPERSAVGTVIADRPRPNPCERDSRTRLPPWVHDGEALVRVWMKDSRLREPVGGQPVHPLPREAVLLATPPQRAHPDALHVIVECSQRSSVGRHYPEVPPKGEYGLTALGKDLCPALDELLLWARKRRAMREGESTTDKSAARAAICRRAIAQLYRRSA
jgi:hypothetical protein